MCIANLLIVLAAGSPTKVEPVPGLPTAPGGTGVCDRPLADVLVGIGGDIPDCHPDGMRRVVEFDASAPIEDVVLVLDIHHTWIGDLRITLAYDRDCDGNVDVGPVAALCRPGLDGCEDDGCCGCSGALDGVYQFTGRFGGDAATAMDADCLDDVYPEGCYLESVESEVPFDEFNDALGPGCFELFVADGACGDPGVLNGWSVLATQVHATPVEPGSWSALKARFR